MSELLYLPTSPTQTTALEVKIEEDKKGLFKLSTSVTVQVWRPVHQLGSHPSATAQHSWKQRTGQERKDKTPRHFLDLLAAARSHPHGFYVCH